MTVVTAQRASTVGAPPASISRTYVAPWGWHTRYMLRAYLVHVFIVTLGLLTLALSIDLPPQLSKMLAAKRSGGTIGAAAQIAWLSVLRAADLMPRFLSFAAFLGVLWVELSHTLSRERVVIWNTGRSPAQCLTPVLLLGLILGLMQAGFDLYLRPLAMAEQITHRLGSYGERYSREPTSTGTWLSAGKDLVFARVEFGPPAVLHQVTVYRLDDNGRILEVDNAERGNPAPDGVTWILSQGNYWAATKPSTATGLEIPDLLPSQSDPPSGTSFDRRQIGLKLDPLRLSTLGISPIFLPHGLLLAIARSNDGSFIGNFQTWVQARYGRAWLPGLMALLASSMSLLLLAYQVRAKGLLTIILAGYVADLATRVFLLLGELGYVYPVVAGWLVPVLLAAVSGSLLWISELQRKARSRT